jgi:hypothetical protein
MQKQSTTQLGDELRDFVLELLEADGHNCVREIRVGEKKVDILLTLDDEFDRRCIAIECKNLNRNLSQKDLAEIHSDYHGLLESNRIQDLWVITSKDITPDARNWAVSRRNFTAFTLTEFAEARNGFRKYVRDVIKIFEEENLSKFYIQQRSTDERQIASQVLDWIDDTENNKPVAILGGYGMGKTSLCRYIVSEVGNRYLQDPYYRVPIYIRLSDIAKEQELEGLIAYTLANRYRVKNYVFSKFEQLNQAGRFLVVCDGFDEMKHALTWAEFQYNFSQINRLISKKSKVLIAGRPNAFLSDDEHSWALRGGRIHNTRQQQLLSGPAYTEITIQPFSVDEAQNFIRHYLSVNFSASTKGNLESEIEKRIDEFNSIKWDDNIFRPVHLKIYSDLACNSEIVLKEYTTFELYDLATQNIARRESSKQVRAPLRSEFRQGIIESIAWWLWETSGGRQLSFRYDQVPKTLLPSLGEKDEYSRDTVLREILSGSFLERKFGENFYFPHRSFVEFFVAKRFANAGQYQISLSTISATINPEIIKFLREGKFISRFVNYCFENFARHSGDLDFYFASELAARYKQLSRDEREGLRGHIPMLFEYLFAYTDEISKNYFERMVTLSRAYFSSRDPEIADIALYYTLDVIRTNAANPMAKDLILLVVKECVSRVEWRYLAANAKATVVASKFGFTRNNIFDWAFLRSARPAAELGENRTQMMVVDFNRMFNEVYELRKPRISLTGREPIPNNAATLRIAFDDAFAHIDKRDLNAAKEVLRAGAVTQISG